jgi:hypothetical protein
MKRLTIALIVLLTIAVIYLFYRINILEQATKPRIHSITALASK